MKKQSVWRVLLPILICGVLCAGIPSAAILTGHGDAVRNVVNTVLVPFEGLFSYVGNQIQGLRGYFIELDALRAENENLKQQLAAMEDAVREAEQVMEENAFLSEFLELKENHDDYRFLKCQVVACEDTGTEKTFTLNAGTTEGAAVGYPVLTAEGVVGRITEVGINWSKAISVTSLSSSVGAYAERSGALGIAEGSYLCYEENNLSFGYLDPHADVEVGDRIRTSGVNSFYPRGLLLGTVTERIQNEADGTFTAVIEPAVDFYALRDVMILTDFALYQTEAVPETSATTDTENTEDTAASDTANS